MGAKLPNYSNTAKSANNRISLILPFALALLAQTPGQCAALEHWQEYLKSGDESYAKKHWGKAEHFFSKAVRYADRSDVGDKNLSLSLRKLGEANMAASRYREAEAHLQRAIKIAKDCGQEDREAIRDMLELAKTYRSVNLEQFGKNVATVLKETGLDGIEILNTKDGKSRVVIKFADKFNKHITSPDINEINLDKKLTFDIHEDKDGTITLNNIKGLKVHSKVWANLTQSSIDPHGGTGTPTALVTAEKLGLTKTVQTVLPKPVYDRILTIVERIKHPELHSPWHKLMQEKLGTTAKAKPGVPITITDSAGGSNQTTGEGDQTTIHEITETDSKVSKSTSSSDSEVTTKSTSTTATSTTNLSKTDLSKTDPMMIDASMNPATDATTTNSTNRTTTTSTTINSQSSTARTQVTGDVISPLKD